MILRTYQESAVNAVYDHLRTRDDNPVVVCPTGAGKSLLIAQIAGDAVRRWNGRVIVLAHVQELLEQNADKFRRLCSDVKVGIYSAGLKQRDTESPIICAGIQSVYKRACELDAFDLVIVDECFVAGTLVKTPAGDVPIEQMQPGMFVCHARGVDRVVATSARPATELVTLEYSDGSAITCTPNHPIFTESGWASAGSLELGSLAVGVEGMRVLWETVSAVDKATGGWESPSTEGKRVDETALLLDLLLEDPQQLHAVARGSQEGEQDDESSGALANRARRQRAAYQTTTGIAAPTRQRLGGGICRSRSWLSSQIAAEEPENRRRKSTTADRDRARWIQPPVAETQTARLSQGDLPGAKRLVRISHHKPAGGRVVFNLHVAGHPSYFANGTLVHNCHLIPPEGDGMYRQFLADATVINPHLRVIGMTATPFRLKSGLICSPEHFLNHVCYEIGIRELIRDGYLCSLVTKAGKTKAHTETVSMRGGEFVPGELESLMNRDALVESACAEIVERTTDRKACLIFATGVEHGRHIARVLHQKHSVECGFVSGETPPAEREELLARFRGDSSGTLFGRDPLQYLCNVNVLTTGFDAPNIDCIALLRPTMSPGLYYQMVGRGFRLHPGKNDCLVLDFGGNVLRHGPVDQIKIVQRDTGNGQAPAKECPECQAVIAAGYATCPDCGFQFPPPDRQQHEAKPSDAGILSGQATDSEYEVRDVSYSVHTKRDAPPDAPKTMRVDYRLGLDHWQCEFICFEHTGFARQKAVAWWRRRSPDRVPDTAELAVEIAEGGGVAFAEMITVRSVAGEKYDRIVGYKLGPIPEALPIYGNEFDEAEIPF